MFIVTHHHHQRTLPLPVAMVGGVSYRKQHHRSWIYPDFVLVAMGVLWWTGGDVVDLAGSSGVYEGGISSVYLWEEDDNEGFVAYFLIKKDGSKYAHGKRGYLHEGGWEAIHVIQMGPDEEGMAHYCLTSTIILSLTTDSDTSGTFNLSGSIRRQICAADSVLIAKGTYDEGAVLS
ncbi:probable F-actin-capping protein subunit beta [Tanacetum coccineum]